MTVPSVMNAATCRAHALAARTDERFNLVHAAKELSPSTTKSGQRGGHRGGRGRQRSGFARSWREGLSVLGLAAGFPFGSSRNVWQRLENTVKSGGKAGIPM